jgi:hypothetical protein
VTGIGVLQMTVQRNRKCGKYRDDNGQEAENILSVGWRRARSARVKKGGRTNAASGDVGEPWLDKKNLGEAPPAGSGFPDSRLPSCGTVQGVGCPILSRTLAWHDSHGKSDEGEQPCGSRTRFHWPAQPWRRISNHGGNVRCLIGFAHLYHVPHSTPVRPVGVCDSYARRATRRPLFGHATL